MSYNKQKAFNAQYRFIAGIMCGILCTIGIVIFARLFLVSSNDDKPPETSATTLQTKNEAHNVYLSTVSEVETDNNLINGYLRIVKFSVSDALYIVSHNGTYTPLLNEDGTPMTLTQFEEAMSNGRNQEQ